MADETSGKGIYDTPVHGSREQSVDKVEDALAAAAPAAPAPEMAHTIEGSILIENDSGVAAAESTGLLAPHDDVRVSDTSRPR